MRAATASRRRRRATKRATSQVRPSVAADDAADGDADVHDPPPPRSRYSAGRNAAVSLAIIAFMLCASVAYRSQPVLASVAEPTAPDSTGDEQLPAEPVASMAPLSALVQPLKATWSAVVSIATRWDYITTDYLDPAWQAMIDKYGERTVVVVITFLFHEVVYFGCAIPWLICDFIPYCRRYKLQPQAVNDWASQWNCFKHLIFSHVMLQIPMMLIFHSVAMHRLGMTATGPLPPISEWLWQLPVYFVVEDFYFYWVHRLLHHPSIYKKVHKIHHLHKAPFGIAAEYAHPIETLVLGIAFFIGPLMFCRHLATLWAWLGVRLWETIEDHSGYDIPWNPTNLIPMWAGANHHDHHHRTFQGNYASVFVFWDWVFGTDVAWRYPEGEQARTLQRKLTASATTPDTSATAGDADDEWITAEYNAKQGQRSGQGIVDWLFGSDHVPQYSRSRRGWR